MPVQLAPTSAVASSDPTDTPTLTDQSGGATTPLEAIATPVSSRRIDVTWTWQPGASDATGFWIERSTDGLNFSLLAKLGLDERSYVDGGLAPATEYWYRVLAVNADGPLSDTATSSPVVNVTSPPDEADSPGTPDLYVDPSGSDAQQGTADQPLRTIQRAADLAVPGAVVHVAEGDYVEAVRSGRSGTAAAPIRYISTTRWGARIHPTGAHFAWYNTGNYVDIIGFDVSGDSAIGLYSEASHVRFIGNHVHNLTGPTCDGNGGGGIGHGGYSSSDNDVIGNVVNDIGTFEETCNQAHGIYHSTLRGKIQNNIVYRVQSWAIHTWHAANELVISNNLVFNNGVHSLNGGGIVVGAGDAPGGVVASNFIVSNNIIIDCNNSIVEYGSVGQNQYMDNVVYRSGTIQLLNGHTAMGTIKSNPQLVDYRPDGFGDYHLQPSSPLIDAGTMDGAPLVDFDGAQRPRGAAMDIGPYER
jgi:hypothetical protein